MAFSPGGEFFLTGGSDGTVQVWNRETRKLERKLVQHKDSVGALAYSPDGKFIATGSKDRTAWLWGAKTGPPIPLFVSQQQEICAVAFSPDSQTIVTGDAGGGVRLFEAETGKPASDQHLQRGAIIWAVAFSPDGRMVLTGSGDGYQMRGEARLWDVPPVKSPGSPVPTVKPLGPPLPHHDLVFAVAFNPTGEYILTGSRDRTARLWRIPTPVEGDVERVVLWTQVITGLELDSEGAVRVLDAQTWRQRGKRLEELGGPPVP